MTPDNDTRKSIATAPEDWVTIRDLRAEVERLKGLLHELAGPEADGPWPGADDAIVELKEPKRPGAWEDGGLAQECETLCENCAHGADPYKIPPGEIQEDGAVLCDACCEIRRDEIDRLRAALEKSLNQLERDHRFGTDGPIDDGEQWADVDVMRIVLSGYEALAGREADHDS